MEHKQTVKLLCLKTDTLVAARAPYTSDIVKYVKKNGIEIIILPKSNRKLKRKFDDSLCSYVAILLKTLFLFLNVGTVLLSLCENLYCFNCFTFYSCYVRLYFFSILILSSLSSSPVSNK